MTERIYEFYSPAGDLVGWIEREGLQVRIVILDDDSEDTATLGLTPELALEAADALRMAADQ